MENDSEFFIVTRLRKAAPGIVLLGWHESLVDLRGEGEYSKQRLMPVL